MMKKKGLPGKIVISTFLGDFIEYEIELDNGQTVQLNEYTKDVRELRPDGQRVKVNFDINAVAFTTPEPGGDFMVKSRKKLDFWFWVKVLVVGFMLIFLFYPFCTLITRSFFFKKCGWFYPGELYPVLYKKILLQCPGAKPVRIRGHHTHNLSGGCAHCLCYVQV